MHGYPFSVALKIVLMHQTSFDLVSVSRFLWSSWYAAMASSMQRLFFTKCLWMAWIGSSGASWQGIQILSPYAFWIFNQGRWRLQAPFSAVDSVMFTKITCCYRLNLARHWVGGRISPQCSWEKKDSKQIACTQVSRPDDLLRPLSKSRSIGTVTGALLLQNNNAGLSSLTSFSVYRRRLPPCQIRPHLSCSFLIANSFTPTDFPASRPAYEEAHVTRRSSFAEST